jgi:serine/threonine protein phosphatase PrpC
LGSDGLFDNLYDDEILEEVQNCIGFGDGQQKSDDDKEQFNNNNNNPQTISDALAHRAKVVSEDPDNPSSPFQVRAMHEGLYYQV